MVCRLGSTIRNLNVFNKSSFSPICIIVKELAPMVSKVFHLGNLGSHHRAQQGEHLGGWGGESGWVRAPRCCQASLMMEREHRCPVDQ